MDDEYDLAILGSGSAAFAAALRAQELGKIAIMTEGRVVGGTCVNRGCLPSKNLIEAARLIHDAANPRYPGLRPCRIEVDFQSIIAQKDRIVRDYRPSKYDSLIGDGIHIETGHAVFVDPHTIEVGGKRLKSEKVLIATGSRPVIPDIEGLDSVPYLTSDLLSVDEAMELRELPESLLVIGGGYVALELGQMFHRFGSNVTILERGAQLLPHGYEREVGQTVGRILSDEGVHIVTQAQVRSVRQEKDDVVATVEVMGDKRQFRAKRLLVATGRQPNADHIAIENAGVALNGGGAVKVNEFLQTNIPHVFAAGDVIGSEVGSQMATPVGSHDGGIAAHNALSGEEMLSVNHAIVPRTIFTDPQVAVVGMTEEQATAKGHRCWYNTIPMSLVPRAVTIRDSRGMVKMVADADTDVVLGVSMVGTNAGEVIHEAAMALRFGATLYDFIDLLHVFPTMAEALKIVAISRFKDPERLSCCAE